MANQPSNYLDWTPSNDPAAVIKPSKAQSDSGFVAGEPAIAQYFNYALRLLDQWTQYLDQQGSRQGTSANLLNSARMINSGLWSFAAATNTVSFGGFNIALPSLPDAANAIVAGSVTLLDGQAAFVNINLPINIIGTVTQGSNQLSNLATTQGIAAGQSISGPGVPAGTTVQSLAGTTVTMSQNASASQSAQPFTFYVSTAPTMQVANMATLVPTPTTVLVARRFGNVVAIGVNTAEAALRDGESKTVRNGGYSLIQNAPAGVALTDHQAVYMSTGAGSRTVGALYPCDASTANGATRSQFMGFSLSAAAAGASCTYVAGGLMGGFSGLTPGAQYYVDPATPGAITATKTVASGQYAVAVGVAISTTNLCLAPPGGMVLERPTDLALSGTLSAQTLAAVAGTVLKLMASHSLVPTDGNSDLGAQSNPFNNVFGKVGFFPQSYLTKIMAVAGADHMIEKSLYPMSAAGSPNNNQNIGTQANYFARVFGDILCTQHLVPISGSTIDTSTLWANGVACDIGGPNNKYVNGYFFRMHADLGNSFSLSNLQFYLPSTAALGGQTSNVFCTNYTQLNSNTSTAQSFGFAAPMAGSIRAISGNVSHQSGQANAVSITSFILGPGGSGTTPLVTNLTFTNSTYFTATFAEGIVPYAAGNTITFNLILANTRGAAIIANMTAILTC